MEPSCGLKDIVGLLVACVVSLTLGSIFLFWPHLLRRTVRRDIAFYEAHRFLRRIAPLVRWYVESGSFLVVVRLIGAFWVAVGLGLLYGVMVIRCP